MSGLIVSYLITPWSSAWLAGNTLDSSVLLCTAGLGAAVSFKAGSFNLGGEGQIYLGGLVSALILLSPAPLPLLFGALAACLLGALMAGLSGLLKRSSGADEMITSFLLSSALVPILDHLVSGPLRDPSGNLLATKRIALERVLPHILEPSSLNLSALILLALVAALALISRFHAVSFRLRVAAANPALARFAGIDSSRYLTPALALSGALYALTGFFAVAGTYGLCHRSFAGSIGWDGIAIALIARSNPLLILPVSILYAWILAGSKAALLGSGGSFEVSGFIQAFVLLAVTARFFRRRKP